MYILQIFKLVSTVYLYRQKKKVKKNIYIYIHLQYIDIGRYIGYRPIYRIVFFKVQNIGIGFKNPISVGLY